MTRPTILVIEDEEGIRKLMQRSLEPEYVVAQAENGREGLRWARATHPQLIFLDLHLPELDGLSVLAQLKADPLTANIPVVIVSVRGETDALMQGQESGAADYLIKPFQLDELRAMARRHVLLD